MNLTEEELSFQNAKSDDMKYWWTLQARRWGNENDASYYSDRSWWWRTEELVLVQDTLLSLGRKLKADEPQTGQYHRMWKATGNHHIKRSFWITLDIHGIIWISLQKDSVVKASTNSSLQEGNPIRVYKKGTGGSEWR